MSVCADEGCGRPVIARGLCTKHYQRTRKIERIALGIPYVRTRTPEELVQHNLEQKRRRLANLENARAIGRRSYHKHHDLNLRRAKEHREANRELINNKKRAHYASLTTEEKWALRIKKTWGITAEQYHEMLEAQDGCCAICRQPERPDRHGNTARLSVDHDHTTGDIRQLLCRACNVAVGVCENASVYHAIGAYLEEHKCLSPS